MICSHFSNWTGLVHLHAWAGLAFNWIDNILGTPSDLLIIQLQLFCRLISGLRDGPPGVFERAEPQLLQDVPRQPPGGGRVPPHHQKVALHADFQRPLFPSTGKAVITQVL